MNFQTMSKQRKFVLIAAAIGIIGMFLPWIPTFFGATVNGFNIRTGFLLFIGLIISGGIALMGNQTANLDKTMWMVTILAAGVTALIVLLTNLSVLNFFTYGFYITILAAVAVVASAFVFRTPGDSFKDGFDSLKKDINSKMNTPNTNSGTNTGSNTGTNPPL